MSHQASTAKRTVGVLAGSVLLPGLAFLLALLLLALLQMLHAPEFLAIVMGAVSYVGSLSLGLVILGQLRLPKALQAFVAIFYIALMGAALIHFQLLFAGHILQDWL